MAARANGEYVTLVREERAIMSLVLSTYVAEISYDIFLISSRHSPYGPVKNADFLPKRKIFRLCFDEMTKLRPCLEISEDLCN